MSCFSSFVSITLMRYIAVGWRAKAQVCVASRAGSVSPGREVEEEGSVVQDWKHRTRERTVW